LGASSSFAEGTGEFVLRSMDARFSGSVDDDELFVSSRQPGTSPDCLCLVLWFGGLVNSEDISSSICV